MVAENYNKSVPSDYAGNYEFYRWFNERWSWEDYRMSFLSLNLHLSKLNPKNTLEIGPGPGTWTKLLLNKNPDMKITLVDVSEAMLEQCKQNLFTRPNLKFVLGDFTTIPIKGTFDFFFSSRTIEYLPDKETAVTRIYTLLDTNASGIIVTKNPGSLGRILSLLIGRKPSAMHSGQISAKDFSELLTKVGFKNIEVYPSIMAFPPVKRIHFMTRILWKMFYKKPLNWFSSLLSESYIITFNK